MQIAILGPLEVRDDAGRPVEVAGGRLRTLLSRLALDAGHPVGLAALVDAVWGEQPPAEETNALQTLVSRLRRALGSTAVIAQSAGGYRLAVEREDVDVHRFARLAASGSAALRSGDSSRAARELTDALDLWRGAALADTLAQGGALEAAAARLEDERLAARIDRIEAKLASAARDAAALVPELEALVAEHPLHERLAGQLVRALTAAGRQADALRAYERLRTQLADELGVDPSGELQEIHLAVLRGNPAEPVEPPGRRTNLKAQLTSFVGRDDEVARIGKALAENRLVTLVGPGGAGKTRLATEAAASILDTTADGIWLAELAPVTAGADLPQAVLGSLGLREIHMLERRSAGLSARDAMTRLREGLADKQVVLVLDNCEHLIEASARLADQLLAECPDLRVLTTSREPLGILGEVLLAVPPLGQPAPDATAAEALQYPAVRLFADRAAAARPGFEVDDDSVALVGEIVRRLDGLPLAIELAAARLRSLPLGDIANRLSDRFRLLTGGSRTALPRHRTLRAVVEWSWDLLTADEQRLVEYLAVFPSGVTADSAAAVRPDDVAVEEVADLLASLVDKSLLQLVDGGRMRMLETIREYGAERLAERGELVEARRRHAARFAAVVAQAEPHLTTADQLPWFELLSAEQDNILAAMRFRCDEGDADGALKIAVALGSWAMLLGEHADITTWLSDALAVPDAADEQLQLIARAMRALNSAAAAQQAVEVDSGMAELKAMAQEIGQVDVAYSPLVAMLKSAVAFFADAQDLAERYLQEGMAADDPWARASSHMFRANLAENYGDVATTRDECFAALAGFREIGERWGIASTLRGIAQLHVLEGDLDAAHAAFEEAFALMAEMHSRDDEVFLLGRLADIEVRRGDLDSARVLAERARAAAELARGPIESLFMLAVLGEIERRVGDDDRAHALLDEAQTRLASMSHEHPAHGHIRAMVTAMQARLRLGDGDVDEAKRLAADAYQGAVATHDQPIVASVGVVIAELANSLGERADAARLLGAAARLRGAADHTDPDIAALTAELRDALGADEFVAEYESGRAITSDEAIARLDPATLF